MSHVAKYRYGFYYNQLDIDQQFVYKKIAAAVSEYRKAVDIDADESKIHRIKMAILYDNPELFYWNLQDSKIVSEQMNLCYYTDTEEETRNLVTMLRDKRRAILHDLYEENMTQRDILHKVYDYLVKNIGYAEDELQKPGSVHWIYDIQGPMLRERGVCQGIAQTLNYFCAALNISSFLVTGEAKVAGWSGNHGWNMVILAEEYYHIDITCDICNNETEEWRYFLKKDNELKDHQWSRIIYPEAV